MSNVVNLTDHLYQQCTICDSGVLTDSRGNTRDCPACNLIRVIPVGVTLAQLDRLYRHSQSGSLANELEEIERSIREHAKEAKASSHGPLKQVLEGLIRSYEVLASQALRGAESTREDMLVWMRGIAVCLESQVEAHLNHSQRKERLRAALEVIEGAVHHLRNMQFDFSGRAWDRGFDTFRWQGPEKRLREENQRLRDEIRSLRGEDHGEFVPNRYCDEEFEIKD